MEAQFTAHNLGLTWEEFGDLRESDLDAVIHEMGLNFVNRGKVVSLWKRHPNKLTDALEIRMINVDFTHARQTYNITVPLKKNGDLRDAVEKACKRQLLEANIRNAEQQMFDGYLIRNEEDRDILSAEGIQDQQLLKFYLPSHINPQPPNEWKSDKLYQLKIEINQLTEREFAEKMGCEYPSILSREASELLEELKSLTSETLKIYETRNREIQGVKASIENQPFLKDELVKACYMTKKYADHESTVDLFVVLLLRRLGFYQELLFLMPQLRLPLKFGNIEIMSKADFICMDILSFFRMAVVEDKSQEKENFNSLPQLVGEAIAVSQANKKFSGYKRSRIDDSSDSEPYQIYGLRVNGSVFFFYIICVSQYMETAIEKQQEAADDTPLYQLGESNQGYNFLIESDRKIIINTLSMIRDKLLKEGKESRRTCRGSGEKAT